MDLSFDFTGACTQPSCIADHFVRTPGTVGLSSGHVARLLAKLQKEPALPQVRLSQLSLSLPAAACISLPVVAGRGKYDWVNAGNFKKAPVRKLHKFSSTKDPKALGALLPSLTKPGTGAQDFIFIPWRFRPERQGITAAGKFDGHSFLGRAIRPAMFRSLPLQKCGGDVLASPSMGNGEAGSIAFIVGAGRSGSRRAIALESKSFAGSRVATMEEAYRLLESTILVSDEEVERRILSRMEQATQHVDAADHAQNVEMDLFGVSVALLELAGRDPSHNDTKDLFVDNMRNLVDELQDHIHSSVGPHQEYLNGVYSSFKTCASDLDASLAEAAKRNSTVNLGRLAHERCRIEQAEAKKVLATCEMAKQDLAKVDECAAWPEVQVTPVADAGSACLKTVSGESYEAYLRRMKSHWDEQLSKYEATKARCATRTIDPAKDCSQEKAALDTKQLECNGAQSTFERGFCDQAVQANKAWYKYLVCYRAAKQSYEDASQTAETIVQSKRVDLDASHRIECLLKVFAKKHDPEAALRECKIADHSSETEKLQIQLRKVPEALAPPPATHVPGDAAFAKDEYLHLASKTSAPLTCVLPFQLAPA
ncbi:cfr [Symbiodinium pilosum]|uniref:Cfr protein n=1 Tax=Symbiodinium pilosum TaxID=2952 RepID=A0A812WQT9_SYMPI|nr:cfr [Symbiodinium pilosum]